ncbi:hypothetical protein PF008_g20180 [Phytophthora fragariae]|uniref:Uncharacterized protein n=1 Tax=Phytophthora fragariae TaxID=53985 RepID=A0A6G0R109_9STRA|nr:hypothetical protein PF008_g20180 [Phytophthora fragariae]
MAELDRRWGFLAPWCAVLKGLLHYEYPKRDEEVWDVQKRRLQINSKKIREALALVSAVAHVDQSAWRYLLDKYCEVDFRQESEDIPARFLVFMDLEAKEDLAYEGTFDLDPVQLCDTHQRKHPTDAYVAALQKISALDKRLKSDKPGVDILIPVRLYFPDMDIVSVDGPQKVFNDIQLAEKMIRRKWAKYEQGSKSRPVRPRHLRCTFVLEPMIASFNDCWITPKMAEMVDHHVRANVWFSQMSLWVKLDPDLKTDVRTLRITFAKMMAAVFDSTCRSPELANTTYHTKIDPSSLVSKRLQLGSVHLECSCWLQPKDVEAMCSAIAVSRTTSKLSLRLQMREDQDSVKWWKWLAYGLFSKQARARSSIESLAFISIRSMSTEDVEAFAAVLSSEHPEEELCGCPRGQIEEGDATLVSHAPIRWCFDEQDESPVLSFPSPIRFVRTFSDDGESEWVDVLVPALGRCQVQRDDLILDDIDANDGPTALTSLAIQFADSDNPDFDSLPIFLAAVGSSLKFLTLGAACMELDDILRCCPNLQELSICDELVEARFNFVEYRAVNEPLPSLNCNWNDIAELSRDLSNTLSPLSKCVRRIRIRLTRLVSGFSGSTTFYQTRIETDLKALLNMLEMNRSLEFISVVVPAQYEAFAKDFQKYHLQPIDRPHTLVLKKKIAFLSAFDRQVGGSKKARAGSSRSPPAFGQDVLENIFKLASPPVLRRVQFELSDDKSWEQLTDERRFRPLE